MTKRKKRKKVREDVGDYLLEEFGLDVNNLESGVAEDKMPPKRILYGMLSHYRRAKKMKPGFEAAKYKQWFEVWPPRQWKSDPAIIPNAWLRQRLAAELKSYHDKKGN